MITSTTQHAVTGEVLCCICYHHKTMAKQSWKSYSFGVFDQPEKKSWLWAKASTCHRDINAACEQPHSLPAKSCSDTCTTEAKKPSLSWSPKALGSHRVPSLLQLSCRCRALGCSCCSGVGEAGLQSDCDADIQIHTPAWHSCKYHHRHAPYFTAVDAAVLSGAL